jgi:DNA replication protein DnaC
MSQQLLLDSYLKTLKLPTFLREYPVMARLSAEADEPYEVFLLRLAEMEVQHRQAQATERRLKQAGFPVVKELSEFDFSAAPKLNKKRVLDWAQCRFIAERANGVLLGPPGTMT